MLRAPGKLSTVIVPTCSSASGREMAGPSPVPPKRRVVLPSAYLNGSKMWVSASGSIPIPVSVTATSTRPSTARAEMATRSRSVN